jgi:hypothetical protein
MEKEYLLKLLLKEIAKEKEITIKIYNGYNKQEYLITNKGIYVITNEECDCKCYCHPQFIQCPYDCCEEKCYFGYKIQKIISL